MPRATLDAPVRIMIASSRKIVRLSRLLMLSMRTKGHGQRGYDHEITHRSPQRVLKWNRSMRADGTASTWAPV